MVDGLLPCPFCGSEAEVYVNSRGYKMAACIDCEAEADLGMWDARVNHIPDASKTMWISVSDRLPDDDRLILVANADNKTILSAMCVVGMFVGFTHEGMTNIGNVTHWMPLPEPPVIHRNN